MTVDYLVPALVGFGVTSTAALILALILFLGRYGCRCGCIWCKQRLREREMLRAFIKCRYKSVNLICSNETCPVCLDDFKSGEHVVVTPCFHGFHRSCVLKCLQASPYCPLCKVKVLIDNAEYSSLLYGSSPHYS